MNCREFQEQLFEYLDGTLYAEAQTAAAVHLAQCNSCRELLGAQQQFARIFSERLRQETESLKLSSRVRQNVVAEFEAGPISRASFVGWWQGLVWPAGIAVALAFAAFLMIGAPMTAHHQGNAVNQDGRREAQAVSIRLSYCAPVYMFRREGNVVTDSLVCAPEAVDGTIWVSRNQKPSSPQNQRKAPL